MGLSITKRPLESFTIGADIRVCIVEVRGNNVTLMIEAPRDILISRGDDLSETKPPPRPSQQPPCLRIPDKVDRDHPNSHNEPAPSIRRRPS